MRVNKGFVLVSFWIDSETNKKIVADAKEQKRSISSLGYKIVSDYYDNRRQ